MKTKKKVLKIRKNIITLIASTILLVVLLKDSSNLISYRYNAILIFAYFIINFIFLIKEKY